MTKYLLRGTLEVDNKISSTKGENFDISTKKMFEVTDPYEYAVFGRKSILKTIEVI